MGESYTGEAVNPANLSWFEGLMGVGRPYKEAVKHTQSQRAIAAERVGKDAEAPSTAAA